MKSEIIVALIAAGTTILTIIGSIVAVKITSNSQIKEQKIAADREMIIMHLLKPLPKIYFILINMIV